MSISESQVSHEIRGSAERIGRDAVNTLAVRLREAYGERFFVHRQMQELVAAGDLGAKTGKGFYEHGN